MDGTTPSVVYFPEGLTGLPLIYNQSGYALERFPKGCGLVGKD